METRTEGHIEDPLTGVIESQTSRLPSSAYLFASIGCMAASAALKMAGKNHWSLFVGQWAAPILIMGVYNKQVKQHGSDYSSIRSPRRVA